MSRGRVPRSARHVVAVAAIALLSFVLNHAPFVFSANPRSLGADGDSWFHVAIQTFLMDPEPFSADPEVRDFYVASRPPIELTIHRLVVALARGAFGGDLLKANLAGFWILNLIFLAGCYALGYRVLGSIAGAAGFAAASAGFSHALTAWWGLSFGGVIPHTLGMAFVPWLVLAYLRWDDHPLGGVVVFAAMGLLANLYPLHPAFLAVTLLAARISMRPLHPGAAFVRALAFAAGALPVIANAAIGTLSRLTVLDNDAASVATTLLERHYGYLLPASARVFAHRLVDSYVWVFVAIAVVTALIGRRRLSDDDRRLVWFGIWVAVLSAVGLVAGSWSHALLAFLFHRASAFLYVPAYLGTIAAARHFLRERRTLPVVIGLLLCVAIALNASWRTPLARRLRGDWPIQASAPYTELANWAREHTPPGSLFLIPYRGQTTYFAFRIYAGRCVMLHYAIGEVVLADPGLGRRFAELERDIAPLFEEPSSTADFLAVAERHDIDFIIVDGLTPRAPELPIVFRNALVTVFDARVRR